MNRITSVSSALLLFGSITAFAQPDPPTPPKPPSPPRNSRVFIQNAGSSFLGVGVSEIDSERAKALNLKEERGVEVKNVDEDSPAAKAGVKVGDVVLDYNGQRVEGTEQFVRFVRETPVGRQVKLLLSRNGAVQTVTAAIGSRPSNMIYMGGDDFKFTMPEVRIPDMPRALMSWQSRSLGVESESLNSQLAEFFGVKEGVLVRSVIKGTAAAKAGLKAGDVITKIGDKKVTGPKDISNALRSVSAGKAFTVTVMRDRKEMTVNATIEEKSSGGARRTVVRMERQNL
jgi:serine protease Do